MAPGEQAYFNDVYLLAPLGYFVVGFDTTILQMNVVGADLLGLSRDNPERRAFRAYIAPRFLDDFEQLLRRAVNSGQPERCDLQMVGRGRQGFPVTLRASADSGGQAVRVVLEPAEGKQAVLERSEERLRRMVHSAGEGVWEIDAAARTSFVNPRMARMLGYEIEEMLDQPLVAFMDDEGRAILERNLARRGHPHDAGERGEFKFLRKDGAGLWVTLATNPIFDGAGVYIGALALVSDVTASRASAELDWRHANFDALTALPNRHMLHDRLAQELKKAQRAGGLLALLSIDLDGCRRTDALLIEAARRIGACVRASDTVARSGGDEFVVILSGLEQTSDIDRIIQNMLALLERPFAPPLDQAGETLSASIGIALFPSDATAPEELLRHAGQAMREAKRAGANRYGYVTPDLQLAAQARQQLTLELRAAVSERQFELHYQPIVNLRSGKIERAEALLRWRHPLRGLLAPAEFLPFAEAAGLMPQLGDWVFRQAARQARAWRDALGPRFQVGINLSAAQLCGDTALYVGWLNHAAEIGLAPGGIVIEIAEGALMGAAAPLVERLRDLREMGLQVALDNFGAGQASLAHLRRLGIDLLKLDRGFIRDIERDSGELALCEALIAMAHKLGLRVVAEGVETAAQSGLLAMAGCDFAQGYVYAAPMPAAEFGALASGGSALPN